MIVCRDEALAKKLRAFREHAWEPRYFHHVIGGNFRLNEIQAAILALSFHFGKVGGCAASSGGFL